MHDSPSVLDRFSLAGRVALVTAGAGRLFGQSISTALAEAGATVVTASRSRERNESFAGTLRSRGYDAHGLAYDQEDAESIERLHRTVLDDLGRLDILVNSALAREGHDGGFDAQTPETWMRSAQSDFIGVLRHCQLALEPMCRQRSGCIINIGSIYGVVANDPTLYVGTDMTQSGAYAFMKGGLVNFTRYLAAYYGRDGVRVNCVSPGGFFDNQASAFVARYEGRVPLGRMMDRADVQGAVVFLASDAAAYVTGVNLLVDGGWTCL